MKWKQLQGFTGHKVGFTPLKGIETRILDTSVSKAYIEANSTDLKRTLSVVMIGEVRKVKLSLGLSTVP
jgi:hypothetical protein